MGIAAEEEEGNKDTDHFVVESDGFELLKSKKKK